VAAFEAAVVKICQTPPRKAKHSDMSKAPPNVTTHGPNQNTGKHIESSSCFLCELFGEKNPQKFPCVARIPISLSWKWQPLTTCSSQSFSQSEYSGTKRCDKYMIAVCLHLVEVIVAVQRDRDSGVAEDAVAIRNLCSRHPFVAVDPTSIVGKDPTW
jgi:hypothetical protein